MTSFADHPLLAANVGGAVAPTSDIDAGIAGMNAQANQVWAGIDAANAAKAPNNAPIPLTLANVAGVVLDAIGKAIVGTSLIGSDQMENNSGRTQVVGAGYQIARTDLGQLTGVPVNNPRFDLASSLTSAIGTYTIVSSFGAPATGTTVAQSGTELSTIRYTQLGETFLRYESPQNTTRITSGGGVTPGTYAAPASDGLVPVEFRTGVYNLFGPEIRTDVYLLRPPSGTMIEGPRPVAGGTGNEVIFHQGYP